jgi:isochorismate hydrolase
MLAVASIVYRIGLIIKDSDIAVILINDAVAIHIHNMFTIQTDNHTLKPALLVIDVQNGFVSKGGSYDRLGMDTSSYRSVIPKMQQPVNLCREVGIPIFFTQRLPVSQVE